MSGIPAAELALDPALVEALLAAQHPALATQPVTAAAGGWDNAVFRLGRTCAVRLPRHAAADALIRHEQRWLPQIADRIGVPVPVPLAIGGPSAGYPFAWSVVPWFQGSDATALARDRRAALVPALADAVAALHRPAPPDAPANTARGGPLATRDRAVQDRLASGRIPYAAETATLWRRLVATPPWAGPPLWLHGDLHPGNLICREGQLAAIIDFGDITAGDPASDLAAAWLVFDAPARAAFQAQVTAACGTDPATWRRARGWALSVATALLAVAGDRPAMTAVGRETLAQVLGDGA